MIAGIMNNFDVDPLVTEVIKQGFFLRRGCTNKVSLSCLKHHGGSSSVVASLDVVDLNEREGILRFATNPDLGRPSRDIISRIVEF